MKLNLIQALRLSSRTRLALVGAGGKTTALFQIARGLTPPVLVTTTTHLAVGESAQAEHHWIVDGQADISSLTTTHLSGVTLVTGRAVREGRTGERLSGLDQAALQQLLVIADSQGLPVLVEADGSRQIPLKAPAGHEPAIPAWADPSGDPWLDLVIVVAGLASLGKPLTPEWVHRAERFAALSGLDPGSEITIEAVARVLCHPEGGLKNIPASVRRVALLNQADSPALREQARQLAALLLSSFHAVIVASLGLRTETDQARPYGKSSLGEAQVYSVYEPVAGIILAAGRSHRYGTPKQLLPWRGIPLVRKVALTALQAGLSPVVLVTGAYHAEVFHAVEDLPVKVVYNQAWASGQSASVKAGLQELPLETGAVVFLLADQPQVPVSLVVALVDAHAATLSPLAMPYVKGRRANPVLFDRRTFPDLMEIRGDTGGRALFARYPSARVEWPDEDILLDIDSEEDYRNLLGKLRET